MTGFNRSIWNALWILLPLGGLILLLAFISLRKGYCFFFDPKHNTDERLKDAGDFGPHSQRYQDLAKLVITLSAGGIAFLINSLGNQKVPPATFTQRIEDVAPIVIGFFGCSIAFMIVFMTLQTIWYEEYSHSPDHGTYTAWKYAFCNAVAWTGLISFVLAFGWLARNIFS